MSSFIINYKFNTNEMTENNNSVINVIGKYTFKNVKVIEESIPVNEDNIMELTSENIDEEELKTALVPYVTKIYLELEINPMCVDIENIKDELDDKPTYEWVKLNCRIY